jgi:CRISPR-associated endonuclease Csn1
LRERQLLRRERLHRVLNVLDFLPEHYAKEIDFEKRLGQFFDEKEPKLAWKKNDEDKFEFIFQNSFNEMVEDFKANGQVLKIPYDWTIYYLRKKALSRKITKEELAWLILNFNQKRGYYQLRGENEEKTDVKEYVQSLKIVLIEKGDKDKKNDKKTWYTMTLENGWKYSATFTTEPNWLNSEKEFLVTEELDENGNIKIVKDKKTDITGKEKRRITPLPSFDEIDLMSREQKDKIYKKIKARTEITISNSGKTVGTYIYETLLQKPNQKIRGKLVRTIERKFYKDELIAILKKQVELQPELFTEEKYSDCIRELYRSNEDRQNELSGKSFVDLFVKDIIFYQRPLRSQKSSIGNCSLEFRNHKINKLDEKGNPIKDVFEKDKDGNDKIVKEYLKAVPKSNPYYQEFRVWQWLYNLKIYTREEDKDVTSDFIKGVDDLEKLFEFLMSKKEITNKDIIEHLLEQNLKSEIEIQIKTLYPKLSPEKIQQKINAELNKQIKSELPKYRWNYVFDNSKEKEEDKSKKYPCNETGTLIRTRLGKIENIPSNFLKIIDKKEVEERKKNEKTGKREKTGKKIVVSLCTREYQLWHIIYSVTDKKEYEQALRNFAMKYSLEESSFVENFKNFKPFKSEYGSFSEKAIKKLLPLMRLGKYWNENEISDNTKERANSIKKRLEGILEEQTIDNVADDDVQKRVLKSFLKFKNAEAESFIKGLQLYQASYLVYGRHSEAENAEQWKMSYDIQKYLYDFRQHSLRNPIVEQVITETLRVVKDIWEYNAEKNNVQPVIVYDEHKKKDVKSYPNIFSEIHIELGREMKNTAEDRAKITNSVLGNESTNLRIKKMLLEFSNDDDFRNETGENTVRPYSPTQQDILKIFEDDVLSKFSEQELKNETFPNVGEKDAKNVFEISRKSQPTKSEITLYKLWLEQKYRSPYTGQIIPLGKLFTPAYEIEHIIPQSRYFDDSFNNKVICEAEVNKLKDNKLGLEFIKAYYGQKVQIGNKFVEIFTEAQYKEFVNEHYKNSNKKRKNLLLEEIPDKMIDRQLNDTRHISKFINKLLSNIVRSETNDDGVNSTNLIPCTGQITSQLKRHWGLNDKWNELILPRFVRVNELTNTNSFTTQNKEGHIIPAIPLELSKGFQFKRIDHRHHALDALVIACEIGRAHV